MPSQWEGWRGTRSWHRTQPGQLTQTGQRGIPDHVMSCPVYKLGAVGLRGDHCSGTNWALVSEWWAIASYITCIFQSFYYYYCHFIIVIIMSFFFSVLLNCSYLNPWVLLVFFPILSPIPLGGGQWVSGCVVLSCWLGLNHNSREEWFHVTWINSQHRYRLHKVFSNNFS